MPNAAIKLHAFTEGHSVEILFGREILEDTPESGSRSQLQVFHHSTPEFNSAAPPETPRCSVELGPASDRQTLAPRLVPQPPRPDRLMNAWKVAETKPCGDSRDRR